MPVLSPFRRASGGRHVICLFDQALGCVVDGDGTEKDGRVGDLAIPGMIHVNDSPVNDDSNTAFGGEKASGIGRFGGHWAIDEFTTEHWISVQHQPRDYPI